MIYTSFTASAVGLSAIAVTKLVEFFEQRKKVDTTVEGITHCQAGVHVATTQEE